MLGKSRSRCHSLNQGTWGDQGTWGYRILILHINYVAVYTGPRLFLFERTHNYSVDNQGLVPWRDRSTGRLKRNQPIDGSDTHRQFTAGFNMAREAGITSFTK